MTPRPDVYLPLPATLVESTPMTELERFFLLVLA